MKADKNHSVLKVSQEPKHIYPTNGHNNQKFATNHKQDMLQWSIQENIDWTNEINKGLHGVCVDNKSHQDNDKRKFINWETKKKQ